MAAITTERRRIRRSAADVGRVLVLLGALAAPSSACDLCAIYMTTELQATHTGVFIGVAEQFTHFGTLQNDGDEIANPFDEFIDSSITQFVLGYRPFSRFGVQLNLPVIAKQFRRATEDGRTRGDEVGFGDLSLLGDLDVYSWSNLTTIFRLSAFAGLELPSGDSGRLREETEHEEDGDEHSHEGPYGGISPPPRAAVSYPAPVRAHHEDEHGTASGVHGHDLALGSGSVDGILGAQAFVSWHRAFFSASVQYLLRSEGDFDYEYADDFFWQGGPGLFLLSQHGETLGEYTLGAQAALSGEVKGKDQVDGETADDTAITSLYIGPRLSFGWNTSLSADFTVDLPVLQDNSALQMVPDYRLRGGISWRF
jgi:hypothetical protein